MHESFTVDPPAERKPPAGGSAGGKQDRSGAPGKYSYSAPFADASDELPFRWITRGRKPLGTIYAVGLRFRAEAASGRGLGLHNCIGEARQVIILHDQKRRPA